MMTPQFTCATLGRSYPTKVHIHIDVDICITNTNDYKFINAKLFLKLFLAYVLKFDIQLYCVL